MSAPAAKCRPELLALLAKLAPSHSASAIARLFFVDPHTIRNWAMTAAIPLLTRSEAVRQTWADPAVRALRRAAIKEALTRPGRREDSRREADSVKVPAWVPKGLRSEYLDIAAAKDEFAAAAYARGCLLSERGARAS